MNDVAQRAAAELAEEGLSPHRWSNEPGHVHGEHVHGHDKALVCVSGSITFHTPDGDVVLQPGDRLDLPAGTIHAATVGPSGVTCLEASRPRAD